MKKLIGYLSIFFSAFFFYLSTYFLKIGIAFEDTAGIIFVHSRFLLGFLIFFPLFYVRYRLPQEHPSHLKVVNRRELFIRALTNTVAVMFFFLGVEYGSVTNANLINMSYPAFVALFSPFLARERVGSIDLFALLLTLVGIFFISIYQAEELLKGDLWSFFSAILAGWAIVSLRVARKTDSTLTILSLVFAFGTLFFLPIYIYYPLPKTSSAWEMIFLTALSGVLGQLFLTFGYRFVNAVEGSIISSSRILIAIFFAILVLEDPLRDGLFLGAVLIFISHLIESIKAYQQQRRQKKRPVSRASGNVRSKENAINLKD